MTRTNVRQPFSGRFKSPLSRCISLFWALSQFARSHSSLFLFWKAIKISQWSCQTQNACICKRLQLRRQNNKRKPTENTGPRRAKQQTRQPQICNSRGAAPKAQSDRSVCKRPNRSRPVNSITTRVEKKPVFLYYLLFSSTKISCVFSNPTLITTHMSGVDACKWKAQMHGQRWTPRLSSSVNSRSQSSVNKRLASRLTEAPEFGETRKVADRKTHRHLPDTQSRGLTDTRAYKTPPEQKTPQTTSLLNTENKRFDKQKKNLPFNARRKKRRPKKA